MSALSVHLLTAADDLVALEPAWWVLWRACPVATPFTSPAWLLPWWRHFHPGPLRTVAVQRGDRLVGLAPLYFEDGPYGRRMLPLGIGVSDHSDWLLAPDDAAAIGSAILQRLAGESGWDVLSLEELPPGAACLDLTPPPGWTDAAAGQSACPGLTLSGGTDEAGLPLEIPGKRRQNVRRAQRAAQARGLAIEAVTDGAAFLAALSDLHARRWESRDGSEGVLADPAVQAFQADAVPALLASGLARCWIARIGGELAGAYYGLVWGERAAFYLSGFDPHFSAESPLTVLIAHGMAEAVREGVRDFSFLRGQEGYKYLWGATDRWNQRRTLGRVDP